ncbi:hypothetical protein [Xanthomonas translucens]|uniref:Uncharacterized protein n=1 Tax=Xanthomonas translucens pv. translucens TaxID=134875 RepID=A0ABW9L0Q3_XANCT
MRGLLRVRGRGVVQQREQDRPAQRLDLIQLRGHLVDAVRVKQRAQRQHAFIGQAQAQAVLGQHEVLDRQQADGVRAAQFGSGQRQQRFGINAPRRPVRFAVQPTQQSGRSDERRAARGRLHELCIDAKVQTDLREHSIQRNGWRGYFAFTRHGAFTWDG